MSQRTTTCSNRITMQSLLTSLSLKPLIPIRALHSNNITRLLQLILGSSVKQTVHNKGEWKAKQTLLRKISTAISPQVIGFQNRLLVHQLKWRFNKLHILIPAKAFFRTFKCAFLYLYFEAHPSVLLSNFVGWETIAIKKPIVVMVICNEKPSCLLTNVIKTWMHEVTTLCNSFNSLLALGWLVLIMTHSHNPKTLSGKSS